MQCVYIGYYFAVDCSDSNHCLVYLCFEGFSPPSSAFLLFRLKKNSFWRLQNDFVSGLVSGELLASPLVHSFSLLSFPVVSFSLSVSFFLSCPCCCGLLLASSMAESSRSYQNCSRNLVPRLVLVIGLYPL